MKEEEIIEKFEIDIDKLKNEQLKLASQLDFKDLISLDSIGLIGAFENLIIKNKIISAVIVCNKNFEIIEEQYYLTKLTFPYLFEFRSYRELPAMIGAYNKLQNRPDVFLIPGNGLIHPRLGLASHFSLVSGIPSIGVSSFNFDNQEVKGDNVFRNEKIIGKVLKTKEKSNPLFISSGNKVDLESCYAFCSSLIVAPHKLPEPMHLAHKYSKSVKKELGL